MNERTEIDQRGDYSEQLWSNVQTKQQWMEWLSHSWDAASRHAAYAAIEKYLKYKRKRRTFAEIGFGGVYDFRMCFKRLHDLGKIRYTGYEVTADFVGYAKEAYPGYDWRIGAMCDLPAKTYDITYSRHILQHVSPDVYEACLRGQLRAARELAVVVWRYPPAEVEYIHYADPNSWQNVWEKERTHRIIEEEGFGLEIVEFDDPDGENIYVMRR